MTQTVVIVPTYNERENLPLLVERLMSLPVPVDLLIVDDNSPDGTGVLADQLAVKHPNLHVLHRPQKNGLGRAYCAGFQWALARGYENIMEMDGDFSHNPDDVPNFVKAAGHADLVLGSRYSNGIRVINWPLGRLMLSMSAAFYVRLITGMPFSDPTGGFKCFRRRALQSIDLQAVRSNGYSFQIEMTHKVWRQEMRVAEVPIVFTDRFQGSSKMSGRIVREALVMVWRLLLQNNLRRRPSRNPGMLGRYLNFCLVGATGVLVDCAVLYLLHSVLGASLGLSKLVAAEIALVNNFIWNELWTFGDHAQHQAASRLQRFLKFNLICGIGIVLSVGLLKLQVSLFGLPVQVANVLTIIAVSFWNFALNARFSWNKKSVPETAPTGLTAVTLPPESGSPSSR